VVLLPVAERFALWIVIALLRELPLFGCSSRLTGKKSSGDVRFSSLVAGAVSLCFKKDQ
jgi:hypothetical protein